MTAAGSGTVGFTGRLLMVGCGSIGRAALPLLRRHLELPAGRLLVLDATAASQAFALEHQAEFIHHQLSPADFAATLERYLGPGDLLLNLSVNVSSLDLIRWCAAAGALYVDTSIEPWPGIYDNPALPLRERTNFVTRRHLLALARQLGPGSPTAIVDHGANPGLVSHFTRQALLNIASDLGQLERRPASRAAWAALARQLGIQVIQVSERDTQAADRPKRPNEFVNTWSIDGFVDELMQPVELSLGSHEAARPRGASWHGRNAGSIFLQRPGGATTARSWLPSLGGFQGLLMSHDEVFSIADALSERDGRRISYRPTVMFVYHPCDDGMLSALELEGRGWQLQPTRRILTTELVTGADELGVLLAGHRRNAYWFGSQLGIGEARQYVPHSNATCVQVAAGALAATLYAMRHPRLGVCDADMLDFDECLSIARPYLGPLVGAYTDWTPLQGRGELYDEHLDPEHPWLLRNIRARQWSS